MMILDEIIQRGNHAINRKDWEEAYRSWSTVQDQEPTHDWAKVKLGKILLELNRLEEAEQLLLADVEAFPDRPYALLHLATIAQKQRNWELARVRWEALLAQFPDYMWALEPYAETLKELGDLDKSERYLHKNIAQEEIALRPSHVKSRITLIEIALMKGQFQLAGRRIDHFAKQYPKKGELIEELRTSLKTSQESAELADYINFDSWERNKWRFRFNNEHRFMFVPVPKVGSSTLAMSLYTLTQGKRPSKELSGHEISNTYAKQDDMPDEVMIRQLKSILVRRDYFTFAFVRNPYTRILSAFLDKIQKSHPVDYRTPFDFKPVGEEEVTFLEFLKRVQQVEIDQLNPHFSPQWYLLNLNKKMTYDFIGRFENLEDDLAYVLDRIDKNRRNKKIISRRSHATHAVEKLKRYYGADEQALVAEIYKDDFKFFGYGLAVPDF